MKKTICLLLLAGLCSAVQAQYTDVINSNRPGASYSAYAPGSNVLQFETGFSYEDRDHSGLATNSSILGFDYVIRYGLLFERLEVVLDGAYAHQKLENLGVFPAQEETLNGFSRNSIGIKYLLYDPWKNPDRTKVNIYSWNENYGFTWKNLIPALALYAGMNFNFGDQVFNPTDPSLSPKILLATQQHLTPHWVLITNWVYDKFTSDDPLFNYVITLTHAFGTGRYSIFAEHQGYHSEAYSDALLRIGGARLMSKNFQLDISGGLNFKDTPSRYFGALGMSYRIDQHVDKPKRIDNMPKKDKKALRKAKKENKF